MPDQGGEERAGGISPDSIVGKEVPEMFLGQKLRHRDSLSRTRELWVEAELFMKVHPSEHKQNHTSS